MSEQSAHVQTELSAAGVWTIELNRPERLNAMTRPMYAAVADALVFATTDSRVRVVLFRGRGDTFCSGQDTKQINVEGDLDTSELTACIRAVIECTKPMVAAIHGHALGFGASLITHCDLVVATPDCKIIYPFTKLGICPAFATSHTLVQAVGRQRAARALLLGESLTAATLHSWGIVTHLARQREEVTRTASRLSMKLAGRRPESVLVTRELIARSSGSRSTLHTTSEAELSHFNRLLATRSQTRAAKGRANEAESLFADELGELHTEALGVRARSEADQRDWCASLFSRLNEVREQLDGPDWRGYCRSLQAHPLGEMLRAGDPLTRRAYDKPRGYAGDAPLLDMMYGIAPVVDPEWPALSQVVRESDACGALKARATMMAERMDALAEGSSEFAALTVAGGHCREVEGSRAFAAGRAQVTSFDLDQKSLDHVREHKAQIRGVRCDILADFVAQQSAPASSFDFAWALGIYDYLNDLRARALTRAVWRTLRSGGVYMIANYTSRCVSVGYGEAVMAWYLHLRETRDMVAVLDEVPAREIADLRIRSCLDDNAMLVLEVRKA